MNYIPKHRDNSRPVDAHSRALILPPAHPVGPLMDGWRVALEGYTLVAGRHREWGLNAGTIVEETLSRHPVESWESYLRRTHHSERGSAQWSAVLILSMFAAFLFALTTVTR